MKQEEERLRRDKQEFERRRGGFDEERDRIGKLGLEVQKRSREIEELCSVRRCFPSFYCVKRLQVNNLFRASFCVTK